MKPIKLSIKRYLNLVLSFLIILPLLFAGGISIFLSSRILRGEMLKASRNQVSFLSDKIDQYLNTPISIIKTMAGMLELEANRKVERDIDVVLKSFTESFDIFKSIHFAGADGLVRNLYPPDELFTGTDISSHEYFKSVMKTGKLFWSSSFISEQLDIPVSTLSYPVMGGVLTATLSLEPVMNMISNIEERDEGLVFYITDQKGVYIAHTDRQKVVLKEYDTAQIAYRQGSLDGMVQDVLYEGMAYTSYYSIVESSGWMVALLQPRSVINDPIETMMWSLLIVTAIILLVTLIFSMSLQKSLAGPLQAFTKLTESISRGNYNVSIPEYNIQELSWLGDSVGSMAKKIQFREKELNEASANLSSLLNSMPSILISIDQDLNITRMNSRAEASSGFEEKDALGKPLEEIFPRLSPEIPRLALAVKESRMDIMTRETILKSDRKIVENVTIFPLILPDTRSAVLRLDDITDKAMMEQTLIQNEKLLSLGGLAAGMAHEINNPLAGMIQTANVLAGRLGLERHIPANDQAAGEVGISMEKLNEYLMIRDIPDMIDSLNKSGQRIASIVNNMLSFARTGEENISTHQIRDIIERSIELAQTDYNLTKKYDFRQIEIIREYGENLPPVMCETSKIQQVFFNILQNSAHAMSDSQVEKPKVLIKTGFDRIHSMVVIEIKDNGPGMEENVRKRIFEPFFTTKQVGLGTGLGLSVSYFIITENQNGEMTVQSSPGNGANFIIKLPTTH
ncbi:PAS domain-containing sensor histidine kinase [Spirochaeta isovalerica]|uniref:histidine kinase n=1 Tax=Spirochaeta isovalerica TaxID=150 RepID=A0A841R8Z1_9SPIO|nr:PAS domain-containing sensor histidine kinase [Spirochaeta isovalerica]MBB6480375.1 PAS domain S-box-containing protein [Spirochaeta isovalerica]